MGSLCGHTEAASLSVLLKWDRFTAYFAVYLRVEIDYILTVALKSANRASSVLYRL